VHQEKTNGRKPLLELARHLRHDLRIAGASEVETLHHETAHLAAQKHAENRCTATSARSAKPGKLDSAMIVAKKARWWSARLHDLEADQEIRIDAGETTLAHLPDAAIESVADQELPLDGIGSVIVLHRAEERGVGAHLVSIAMYLAAARLGDLATTRSHVIVIEIVAMIETGTEIEMRTDAEAEETMTDRKPWRSTDIFLVLADVQTIQTGHGDVTGAEAGIEEIGVEIAEIGGTGVEIVRGKMIRTRRRRRRVKAVLEGRVLVRRRSRRRITVV
jgi:hypothetical protein